MKFKRSFGLGCAILIGALTLTSQAFAGSFAGVKWTRDTSNTPHQDKSGSGNTPSTSGATNNQGQYTFRISTSNSSSTQRQEWQYERRSGYMRMNLFFRIDSRDTNFDRIGVAQNHDDQTGSAGVFSIYQIRKSGNGFVFGVQGDTTEASNGYSTFDTVNIELDTWYRLDVRSFVAEDGAFEIAQLRRRSNNQLLWQEQVQDGGDVEGYYKLGAYRLTGGRGPVTLDFEQIRFYTGSK